MIGVGAGALVPRSGTLAVLGRGAGRAARPLYACLGVHEQVADEKVPDPFPLWLSRGTTGQITLRHMHQPWGTHRTAGSGGLRVIIRPCLHLRADAGTRPRSGHPVGGACLQSARILAAPLSRILATIKGRDFGRVASSIFTKIEREPVWLSDPPKNLGLFDLGVLECLHGHVKGGHDELRNGQRGDPHFLYRAIVNSPFTDRARGEIAPRELSSDWGDVGDLAVAGISVYRNEGWRRDGQDVP